MVRKINAIIILLVCLSSSVIAADLFEVIVQSPTAANRLDALDIDAVIKTNDGYLVLAEDKVAEELQQSGLEVRLIATGISRNEIALDVRLDNANVSRYPLLYESGELRVYRADHSELSLLSTQNDLAPISSQSLRIQFEPAKLFDMSMVAAEIELDSLISLVEIDSLMSYLDRLQAFGERVTGTDSGYASIEWTIAKFQAMGYDSVYTDEFTATIYGSPALLKNVVATKLGTRYPERYIIVGGHRDGVPSSPAADDNGSGTAGVLEIARILQDIETDLSYIFLVFDGEEQGLHGAWNYADLAAARGDTIVYMLNMDMIAHYENSTEAKLYHGSDDSYSVLWMDLASSLVGLTGYLQGNTSGSDHYPFSQHGYAVTFVHENIFSTVYHSYQDSTRYLDFDYMTKMVKASLATVYTVGLNAAAPGLDFSYPAGKPISVTPDEENTFDVVILPLNDAEVIPGTAMINYRIDGGAYQATTMTQVVGNQYEATLPAVTCNNVIEFYLSAEEITAGLFSDPDPSSPHSPAVATEVVTVIADSFETNLGWTAQIIGATSGQWQRGVPVNDPGWDYDPASDADGSGQCYLTQNQTGNTDVDGGAVRLTSPTVDMLLGGIISYDYFLLLTNSAGGIDMLLVEINSNGGIGTWTEIARHDTDGGLSWRHHEITEADLTAAGVTLTSTMMIRFTVNDDDPQSIVEAGVDGFHLIQFVCESEPFICGDGDNSGGVDIDDVVFLIQYIFAGGPAPEPLEVGDADCSGGVDIDDVVYLIQYIFGGGPVPCEGC